MNKVVAFVVLSVTALWLANTGWADIPAPPVNQTIGMKDASIGNFTEAKCRECHSSGVPDRHHLLYGQSIPAGSLVPYPGGTVYSCISCHGPQFNLVRDCLVCHKGSSPHHTTPQATNGDCKSCHGSVVDNRNDGHYIPIYQPSLVTPTRSQGDGLPKNSRGNGAGACNYCHDQDNLTPHVILTNMDLHHGTGLSNCSWCHDFALPFASQIRVCENCHGPKSLHNIQADSPSTPTGTIVVGGELAGYGHVGRDAGPTDSDCWGCHGFATAFAPDSGPVIPTVYDADQTTITAGSNTLVVLTGAAFTSTMGNTVYDADVALTAADGSSVTLTPDIIIDETTLAVTIPGNTAPGNYGLKALKVDFTSNPAVISIVPQVKITRATSKGKTVTITGSGFSGYAAGSGTSVTGVITTVSGRKTTTKTVGGTIVSWANGKIVVSFDSPPSKVTVNAVFGSATSKITKR